MNNLTIAGTSSSPSIQADWQEGRLSMQGDSYPENSFELFQPVIAWVNDFLTQETRPLRLEFELLYLNTSSIRVLMDILDMAEEYYRQGRAVSLAWRYDAGNERVAELAAEFKEDCSFPFAITAKAVAKTS